MTSPADESHVEILLVEDNPDDAELTLRALRKRNLANDVVWLQDGAEALEFIFGADPRVELKLRNAPKVILLDLNMPRLGGLEVLAQLKNDQRTRSIPVVVLTSSQEDRDIARAYGLGANSFIVKPVEFDKFSETVAGLGMYWLLLNQPPAKAN